MTKLIPMASTLIWVGLALNTTALARTEFDRQAFCDRTAFDQTLVNELAADHEWHLAQANAWLADSTKETSQTCAKYHAKLGAEAGSHKAHALWVSLTPESTASLDELVAIDKVGVNLNIPHYHTRLGLRHLNGHGVKRSQKLAIKQFKKGMAGDHGDAESAYQLALLSQSRPLRSKHETPCYFFQRAVALNHKTASIDLIHLAATATSCQLDKTIASTAFKKNQTLANQGNAKAMAALGYQYKSGQGTAPNVAQSFHWYRAAARGGDTSAMLVTANLYETGFGVEPSPDKAMYWYQQAAPFSPVAQTKVALTKLNATDAASQHEGLVMLQTAANQGSIEALMTLAENKQRFPLNEGERLAYAKQAWEAGHVPARTFMAKHWLTHSEQTAMGLRLAKEAAQQGDAEAAAILAEYYYVEGKAPTEARQWAHQAAKQSHPDGLAWYGYFLRHGIGGPQNMRQAIAPLKKASELGQPLAQRELATAYLQGIGVPKDGVAAQRLFRQAAFKGDRAAQQTLSQMYWRGEGTPANRIRALAWAHHAAKGGDLDAMEQAAWMASQLNPTQQEQATAMVSLLSPDTDQLD